MTVIQLISPILFLVVMLVMVLIVPREFIIEYLWAGLLLGAGIAFVLLFFMELEYGFWSFEDIDLITINGLHVFLAFTWLPLIIIYTYFIMEMDSVLARLLTVTAFPALSVLSHYIFIHFNLLQYNNWEYVYTFLISLLIHLAVIGVLYVKNDLRS